MKHTSETIAKIKAARAKQVPPWLGKKRDKSTIDKMRIGNLGKRRSPATEFKKGMTPWNKGKKYGKYIRQKGYAETHAWLKYHFGKADKCDNLLCENSCTKYQWAKLKNVPYERKRENFIKLCQSCHQKYDRGINFDIQYEN